MHKKTLTKLSLDHEFEETSLPDYQYFYDWYAQLFFVQDGSSAKNYDENPKDEPILKWYLNSLHIQAVE